MRILSADVNHDFWLPNLGRKVDAILNHPNYVWMQPSDTGLFFDMCAEFCGAEHVWIRFAVVVEPPEQCKTWLERQVEQAVTPVNPDAIKGQNTFMSMTCRNCHAIRGTIANSDVGPDLTHIASGGKIAGGVLKSSKEDMKKWLRSPQKIKPRCHMPDLDLNKDPIYYLTTYLESLK